VADVLRPDHTVCDRDPHANVVKAALHEPQEFMHPDADGYIDMTAALVRWSARSEIATLHPVRTVRNIDGPRTVATFPGAPLDLQGVPVAASSQLTPGVAVAVQGDGFAPGAPGHHHSAVRPGRRRTIADSTGPDPHPGPLPDDLPPGPHTVIATGLDPSGAARTVYALIDIRRPQPMPRLALWRSPPSSPVSVRSDSGCCRGAGRPQAPGEEWLSEVVHSLVIACHAVAQSRADGVATR